jgi:hypothetical protein
LNIRHYDKWQPIDSCHRPIPPRKDPFLFKLICLKRHSEDQENERQKFSLDWHESDEENQPE